MNVFKNWMKKIEKDNAAFKKANKARKRIMIAKDVIKGVEAKLFNATGQSGYFTAHDGDGGRDNGFYYNTPQDADFRDTLIKMAPNCDVCAKGAIFTCAVMRRDKITHGQFQSMGWTSGFSLSENLGGIFDADQLNLIELHYENFDRIKDSSFPFEQYSPGSERLVAIMRNIIKYKGTFRPEME